MPEGSVMLDGFDAEVEETEGQDQENVNNQVENQGETEGQPTGEQSAENQGEQKPQPQKPDDKQVTEKGTKLAADPLQQANQLRANAEARVREYETFLSDPQQVKRYLEELEKETGQSAPPQGQPQDEITLDQVQTREDVVKYLEQERRKDRAEIEQIKKTVNGFMQNQGQMAVGQKIRSQIEEARRKYPVLRPTNPDGTPNPDFDADLEREIGEAFDELDFDPATQSYRGKVDFSKLVERFMKAAKRGESQGSKKAQTVIQDRRAGRIVTGPKSGDTQPDESNMTPSQVIASRMARAAQRR